jgi:chromosome segregation ATPase
VQFLK